ncbi:hypothetical protein KP509_21G053400 [Ceratopteris richardii]|nr:hypothetical protein KP509_21G053400 [Ceratopteris richardii]
MDCSLSTWPSISQFDDLTWMGLGDIDPLKCPDRTFDFSCQFADADLMDPVEWRFASPVAGSPSKDAPIDASAPGSNEVDILLFSGLPGTRKWESMNWLDFSSGLDDSPPCDGTSTPQGGHPNRSCNAKSAMQSREPEIDNDSFMSSTGVELSQTESKIHLVNNDLVSDATGISSESLPLLSTHVAVKHERTADEDDSSVLINTSGSLCGSLSQATMENSLLITATRNTQCMEYMGNTGVGTWANTMPLTGVGFSPQLMSRSEGTQMNHHMSQSQHQNPMQPNALAHWSLACPMAGSTDGIGKEQVVHNQIQAGSNYQSILEQQTQMDLLASEMKRNRAQASRARRIAASQRRAKKYPLQKLIRMSSSPLSVRDRLGQIMPVSAPASTQSIQSGCQNELTTFTPGIFHSSTPLSSRQSVLAHAKNMHVNLLHHPEQHSLDLLEDKVLPTSGSFQAEHCTQSVQSSSTEPSTTTTHLSNSSQTLDAVVLNELQSVVSKMNVDSRLCIRNALYRLANSAKQRKRGNAYGFGASESHMHVDETDTNSIDRWIVNMLFYKQPPSFKTVSQTHLAQSSNFSMDKLDSNSSMRQWKTCGSA